MKFYLMLAAVVAVMFAIFIGVIVVGANLVGRASGSKQLESTDPKERYVAMRKVVLALFGLTILCWLFGWIVRMLP